MVIVDFLLIIQFQFITKLLLKQRSTRQLRQHEAAEQYAHQASPGMHATMLLRKCYVCRPNWSWHGQNGPRPIEHAVIYVAVLVWLLRS